MPSPSKLLSVLFQRGDGLKGAGENSGRGGGTNGGETGRVLAYEAARTWFENIERRCKTEQGRASKDKPSPPLQQLVDDGILAIVAGSDTSSSCLTSLFFFILTHPEIYTELQAEVDRHCPTGMDLSETLHHRDMTYLHAVINETLRLLPPVMTSSPRKIPTHAPAVHLGFLHIPPGTFFFIPPYSLHRDARNFSLPDAFWPERWLIASGRLRLEDAPLPRAFMASPSRRPLEFVHNEGAFIAFSHGPMNCVGKGFAMQEIQTVVCALLRTFSFRLEEGWDPRLYEVSFRDYMVSSRPALPVVLEPRRRD
ncbi:cytochrome P450 [Cerioporus squamosus]|nr:cytochrome P450 [Cerioporus squamosus]